MARQKRLVRFDRAEKGPADYHVWADLTKGELLAIAGVVTVWAGALRIPCYHDIVLDPRYDAQEVLDAIADAAQAKADGGY